MVKLPRNDGHTEKLEIKKEGVPSVKVLVNGWSRWRAAGCPIEKEEE